MTDKEMLMLAYGAMSAAAADYIELKEAIRRVGDHLFAEKQTYKVGPSPDYDPHTTTVIRATDNIAYTHDIPRG